MVCEGVCVWGGWCGRMGVWMRGEWSVWMCRCVDVLKCGCGGCGGCDGCVEVWVCGSVGLVGV